MTRIQFELAQQQDNKELIQLMANMPMPGAVRVTYRRDPDFFRALRVEGRFTQTLVGRDTQTGQIAGMGTRSIKPVYINAKRRNLGYLSCLRVSPPYRRSIHLARGYRMLRELHEDEQTQLYLSAIISDNKAARCLTQGRRGLPSYRDIGRLHTLAISLSQDATYTKTRNLTIRPANRGDVPMLVRFLNDQGRKRQFFPAYEKKDFLCDGGLLQGLHPSDILLAFEGSHLVGTVAAWDQKSYRRNRVEGYTKGLHLLRLLYNLGAKFHGKPTLPRAGSTLDGVYLALPCIMDDRGDIFSTLLAELMTRHRSKAAFMLAGLHEADPLLPILKRYRYHKYLSQLYIVHWSDGERCYKSLDGRVPYIELGAL